MAQDRRERKIVTVVFADLVGFTSRAESLDPEDVEAILNPYHDRLRAELERHGGTVEKFIGDAVMAVFGPRSCTRTMRSAPCAPRLRSATRSSTTAPSRYGSASTPARRSSTSTSDPSPEVAFAAAAGGHADDLLQIVEAAPSTKWSQAAAAFARGRYSDAAAVYAEIGTLPAEAYVRLAAGDEANVRRALDFYRSVGAKFYIERAESLLPASA